MSNEKGMVVVETKEYEKLIIGLKGLPTSMTSAVQNSLNRAIQSTKAHVMEFVKEEYKLVKPQETFRMWPIHASSGSLQAGIAIIGRLLSFGRFAFTPPIPGSRGPVKVRIKAKDSYKDVHTDPKVFVAPTGTANREKIRFNVFKRMDKPRLPITVLRTLSVPQMVANDKVAQRISDFALSVLEKRIDHDLEWALHKVKKSKR